MLTIVCGVLFFLLLVVFFYYNNALKNKRKVAQLNLRRKIFLITNKKNLTKLRLTNKKPFAITRKI
jgi:preprotein translocase subunit SecG